MLMRIKLDLIIS